MCFFGNLNTPVQGGGITYHCEQCKDSYFNRSATYIQDGLTVKDSDKLGVPGVTPDTMGRSLDQLKQRETYENWDFDTVWNIDETVNGGLPWLRWQTIEEEPVDGVSLDRDQLILYRGEDRYLAAVVSPVNAGNCKVIWDSSDDKIAQVDQYGRVTGHSAGQAMVTVATAEGGFTASCTVRVMPQGRPIACTIENIQILDFAGNKLDQIPAGAFMAEASVSVTGTPSAPYYVMLAAYDAEGAMKELSYMKTKVSNGQTIAYGCTVKNNRLIGIKRLKVMVLDEFSTLIPLAESAEFNPNATN